MKDFSLVSTRPAKFVGFLGGAALLAVASASAFAAGPKIEDAKDSVEARREIEAVLKAADTAEGKLRIQEIAQKINLPSSDFVDFLKAEETAGRLNGNGSIAWVKLINGLSVKGKSHPTAEDFRNADIQAETVGAYIRLRKSGVVDNFHVTESDLVAIQSWTPQQKGNFASVLRRSAEIAENGNVLTAEKAFEKALDEKGLLEKYRAGCSK